MTTDTPVPEAAAPSPTTEAAAAPTPPATPVRPLTPILPIRGGKIGRLPLQVRDELNKRLENGDATPDILRWINSLHYVREFLRKNYDSKAITKQNLCGWRLGGFQDYVRAIERVCAITHLVQEMNLLSDPKGLETLDDRFGGVASLSMGMLLQDLAAKPLDCPKHRDELRKTIRDFSRLRADGHRAIEFKRKQYDWNHHWTRNVNLMHHAVPAASFEPIKPLQEDPVYEYDELGRRHEAERATVEERTAILLSTPAQIRKWCNREKAQMKKQKAKAAAEAAAQEIQANPSKSNLGESTGQTSSSAPTPSPGQTQTSTGTGDKPSAERLKFDAPSYRQAKNMMLKHLGFKA